MPRSSELRQLAAVARNLARSPMDEPTRNALLQEAEELEIRAALAENSGFTYDQNSILTRQNRSQQT